jgi:hypothetical protein
MSNEYVNTHIYINNVHLLSIKFHQYKNLLSIITYKSYFQFINRPSNLRFGIVFDKRNKGDM